MDELDEFIKEVEASSPFLRFEDGESVVGTYGGAKVIDDTFNKGEKTVRYTLTVDDVEKTFNSKSVNLAKMLNKLDEGDEVQITKTGESFHTKWYVKKL